MYNKKVVSFEFSDVEYGVCEREILLMSGFIKGLYENLRWRNGGRWIEESIHLRVEIVGYLIWRLIWFGSYVGPTLVHASVLVVRVCGCDWGWTLGIACVGKKS